MGTGIREGRDGPAKAKAAVSCDGGTLGPRPEGSQVCPALSPSRRCTEPSWWSCPDCPSLALVCGWVCGLLSSLARSVSLLLFPAATSC